jgi:hypothetical protein
MRQLHLGLICAHTFHGLDFLPMDEEENLRRLLNTPPQPKTTKKLKAGARKKAKAAKKPRR